MKRVKRLSSISNKLAFVSELDNKKRQFISSVSPNPKEKHNVKSVQDKIEPMVLRSPPTGESVVRYALPIPSIKTRQLIAEDEIIRKAAKHLSMVVSSLEETYGVDPKPGKKSVTKTDSEELSLSIGDDLNSLLVYCSQYAAQLEEAVKEGRNILESLFKWFQHQVNQIEELSTDQTYSEEDLPVPDKTVSAGIAEVIKQMQKLEELRDQLKHGSKYSLKTMLSKPTGTQNPPETVQVSGSAEKIIEDFLKAHSAEEFTDTSATEPQTGFSMTNRLNAMMKIFEKQSSMLERAINDQGLLEAKYNKMHSDFQLLSEEKSVLENELQKLKNPEKTKPTSDRTKNTPVKSEKKKDKGKSEESEEKKSIAKQPKTKDLLEVQNTANALEIENKVLQEQLKQALQEAEKTKHQLDYLLNQRKELLKSEQTKTAMQVDISEVKVKDLDSETVPLAKERRKTRLSDSGEHKSNDRIQQHPQIPLLQRGSLIEKSSEKKTSSPAISDLSQILKSQHQSAFLKHSSEASFSGEPSHEPLSETHDKPFTIASSSKEGQDSSSVGMSPEGNETVTTSLISHPVFTKRKSKDRDTSKTGVSEEKLQSKTENQTHQGEEFQAQEANDEVYEKLLKGERGLDKKEKQLLRKHHQALSLEINSQDDELDENMLLEDQDSVSKTQMQVKKQRTSRGEKCCTQAEETHENTMLKNQDSVSKTHIEVKKQRKFRDGKLNTQDNVPDENLILENQDSKTQMKVKKQRTFRGEKHNTYDEGSDENLMLENQDSVSETQIQVKKQRNSRGEKHSTHDEVPDENLMLENQDSVSKTQIQVKKQRTSKGGKHSTLDEVPVENLMLENQDSVSDTQIRVEKQITSREEKLYTQVDKPDENILLEDQDSVSKTQGQVKNQRTSTGGKHHTPDEVPDENLFLEKQDSVSKTQMQVNKQSTSREEKLKSPEEVPDENLFLEKRDSVSKTQVQIDKQSTSREEKLQSPEEVPDENLFLEKRDSVLKSQMQVDKQITSREEKLQSPDKVPDENLFLEKQDSVSKTQKQVIKRSTSTEEKLQSPDKVPDENLLLEKQDSVSKTQMQVIKQSTSREEKLKGLDEVPDENLMFENQDSVLKTQTQVDKQSTSEEEKLKSLDEQPNENIMLQHEDSVLKAQMKVKRQSTSREEKPNTFLLETPQKNITAVENLLPMDKVLNSRRQSQSKKHGTTRNDSIYTEKTDEPSDGNLSHEDKILPSQNLPQIKKLETPGVEGPSDQGTYEEVDVSFTSKNLELPERYMDQILTIEVDQSQRLRIKNEAASEVPNTAENLSSLSPSISDLIVQLGLNQVVETDIEHLTNAVGKDIIKETQLKSRRGTHLFKNMDLLTQHQEDKQIASSKFPIKVITLSLFEKQEKYEFISPYVIEYSKPYSKLSKDEASTSKTTKFPSLNKAPPVRPNSVTLNQRVLKFTNNLPSVTPTHRNSLYAGAWKKNMQSSTKLKKLAKRDYPSKNKEELFKELFFNLWKNLSR